MRETHAEEVREKNIQWPSSPHRLPVDGAVLQLNSPLRWWLLVAVCVLAVRKLSSTAVSASECCCYSSGLLEAGPVTGCQTAQHQ